MIPASASTTFRYRAQDWHRDKPDVPVLTRSWFDPCEQCGELVEAVSCERFPPVAVQDAGGQPYWPLPAWMMTPCGCVTRTYRLYIEARADA